MHAMPLGQAAPPPPLELLIVIVAEATAELAEPEAQAIAWTVVVVETMNDPE